MKEAYKYPGNELLLFEKAVNWKKYFASQIISFIKGDVLEAGAGLGANTLLLNDNSPKSWTLLEPDESRIKLLKDKIITNQLPKNSSVITGTLNDVSNTVYDTIIYIDVLEHIEKDNEELIKAVSLLKPGGHVIVLSPAFQFLYSPFDQAIGHYRRYSGRKFKKIAPTSLSLVKLKYLDSIGFFASLSNRILLRQSHPTRKQIYLWDKLMIPVSRFTDKLFFYSFGKSFLAILKKDI
jgi:hypothetical protein